MDATNAVNAVDATNSVSPGLVAGMMGMGLFLWLILFAMYFLPTLIAALRKHRQTAAIAAVNILLGWTVLGWIASFVWSLTAPSAPQIVIVQQPPGTPPAV